MTHLKSALVITLFLSLPNLLNAQADTDEKFFCDVQDRILTDDDFVRLALGYELEKMRGGYRFDTAMPEGYEIGSVDEFLTQNPECCSVERDPKNMRNQSTSWIARLEDWLDGEQISIGLLIPSNTVGEPMVYISYYTDECGELNYDRFLRYSNYNFTK